MKKLKYLLPNSLEMFADMPTKDKRDIFVKCRVEICEKAIRNGKSVLVVGSKDSLQGLTVAHNLNDIQFAAYEKYKNTYPKQTPVFYLHLEDVPETEYQRGTTDRYKVVCIENGKQKVIQSGFTSLQEAEAEVSALRKAYPLKTFVAMLYRVKTYTL